MANSYTKVYARALIHGGNTLPDSITQLSAECIKIALKKAKGNRTHAAEFLGMERATLVAQIKRLYRAGLLREVDLIVNNYGD